MKQYIKDNYYKYSTKLSLFTGKSFHYDINIIIGASVIVEILNGNERKGFHYTFDNYYSNMYFIGHLAKNNKFFTYTFSKNITIIPKEIKNL